jgi:hypothetical protein
MLMEMNMSNIDVTVYFAVFMAGGLLAVLATHMENLLGPKAGAAVWVFPVLLTISVIALKIRGRKTGNIAQYCQDSAYATMLNALTNAVLGLLLLYFRGDLSKTLLVSVSTSMLIGYLFYKLY